MDLKSALENIEKEKNVDRDLVIEAMKEALHMAAKKIHGECDFEVRFDESTKEFEVWKYRIVVEDGKVMNKFRQIAFSEAVKVEDSLQVGDEIGEILPHENLGRIAAQSARQVMTQKVLEAEREKIVSDFREKKHQIVNGIVRRFDKQDMIVDLGACEAILPMREQMPNEKYKIKDKISCYVLDVKKSSRGPQIILSRADSGFLVRLFEQEVAEIIDGVVQIRSAARDPGSRSKIAVYSEDSSVDPVGACVGMRGARVQAIVQELHGEKVDIVPFHPDAARFVCNALAPAAVSKVVVNDGSRMMEVVVPDDQLSLAIGKRGQNVRLAAQLTGWKVDIRSESKMKELSVDYREKLAQIECLGGMRADILVSEGYKDYFDIAKLEPKTLVRILRLEEDEAKKAIASAKELSEKARQEAIEAETLELEEVLSQAVPVRDGEEDELEKIVATTKVTPLQDPELVDTFSVPKESLRYWMGLLSVGEQTAALLFHAGFSSYAELSGTTVEEIVYKTGLSNRYAGKLHNEASKKSSI